MSEFEWVEVWPGEGFPRYRIRMVDDVVEVQHGTRQSQRWQDAGPKVTTAVCVGMEYERTRSPQDQPQPQKEEA